jgi:hypothetical protein
MLPLLRVLLPGGFLIVTLGLVAGFAAPAGSRAQFVRLDAPARGPLIARDEHPEWKQFLLQAAVRRAHEVEQLRDLPSQNTAEQPSVAPEQTAGLPAPSDDIKPEDATGSISGATINDVIPIDIGETSSTELPIGPPQTIPTIERPQRLQLPDESSAKPAVKPKARAAKARNLARPKRKPKPTEPEQTNPLLSLFGANSAN